MVLTREPTASLSALEMEDVAPGDEEEYPEGGLEAWLVVLGAWCGMIPSMGLLNSLAVLHAWVHVNELPQMSETTVGWIFSTYAFFLYVCGAQVGPIFDTYNVRWLLVPGSIGIVASVMFFSVSHEFYQFFLSFGVLGGISASMLFNPSIAAIGHWFQKRRALATGIACTAGGIGGIVFPLIILYASPHIGFGWSMRIVGFLCLAACIAASLLLRKRLPPSQGSKGSIDLKALGDPSFGLTTLAVFLVEFAVFIPYTYISSYAISVGVKPQSAYLLNTLLNAGAIPGRALPGYVGDRFGTFNTMCITSGMCSIFILALWTTSGSSEAKITAFTVIFGFWSGAAISLTPVCIGRVCKTEDYGKRSGTAFSIASIGALIGIPIAGALVQVYDGKYDALIYLTGAVYAASFLAFTVSRGVAGGWSLKQIF